MALARWNGVVQDAEGNAVSGAQIEVRNEATGGLAPLYADRDGAVGLGNPYVAPGAEIAFHARGGNYRITASKGSELKTWRWVAIGTSQGVDVEDLIVGLQAGIITAQTLAELDANAPETPDPGITPAPRGGVVWNDPSPALNGYYTYNYTETAWEYARPLPDTFAKVLLSGTGTAQTGVLAAGVSPAGIEVFFAKVGVPNTGALTLSINGGAVRQVVNLAGNPLSAGEWTGMVMFYLNEDGQYQLLIDAGAAASASQSATEAYADRLLAEAAAEAAQSVSQTLPIVATRVGLKALDYELLPHAILTEGTDDRFSRHGSFSWVAGDFTAQVAADLQEGIFIASASDPIGAAGCWVRDRNSENEYNVCWFGAVGINSSAYSADNHAAFQGFVNLARALGRRNNPLTIPGGDYRVGDEIECFRTTSPRVDISFNGAGEHETRILSDFFGSDKALFKLKDPAGSARCAPTNWRNIQLGAVTMVGGANPMMIDYVGCGEARFEKLRFAPTNNTKMALGSIQNTNLEDITAVGHSSKSWMHKNTDGLLFNITGSDPEAMTLTCTNGSPFTSGSGGQPNDATMCMVVVPTANGDRRKLEIVSVTNGTTAVVRMTTAFTTTGASAYFEHARGTMANGSNRLAVNANIGCFVPEDLGRIVYVRDARSGASGSMAFLRARIIQVENAYQVRLGDEWGNPINADRGIATPVEFFSPAFDFYAPRAAGTLGARSTDVKMFNIRIADFEGVAMAFNNMQQLVITGVKVEGISTSISSGHVSCGSAVFDDCGAEVFGYDCSTHSSAGRARIWAADQRNMLNIYGLTTRNFRSGYEKALWLRPVIESGGGVCVTNFSCSWNVPNNDFLFQDDSSVRSLLVRGLILATTDKAAALGFNSEVSVDGDVKAARRLVTLAGILELGAQVTSGTIPNGCIGRTSGGLAYRNGAGALFTINLTAV